MKAWSIVLLAGLLAAPGLAHKEESPAVYKRHAAISERCSGSVADFHKKRWERRNALKLAARSPNATVSVQFEAPYFDYLKNDTCVLSPDVTAGPYYWPRSEVLRQHMAEDQVGTPLTLDVGLIDISTCEPLPNALVSFWHCNATGSYSSFTGRDPNTEFIDLLTQLNISDFEIGVTDLHTDDSTWLRGMWPSDGEGVLEMKTIFPGFYTGRAIHIHTQVFTNWTLHTNGTLKTGDLNSIGQLYFNESISETIMALEPYVSHTEINRTTNDVDSVYSGGFENGFNPVIDIIAADGEDITKGMIGYITIGVDTTASPELAGEQ